MRRMVGAPGSWLLPILLVLAHGCGGSGEDPRRGEGGTAGEPGPAVEEAAEPARGRGAIRGVVRYAGPDPDEPIDFAADPVCVDLHAGPELTETVVTGDDGGLANVFVHLGEAPAGTGPPPGEPALLDQVGCLFVPRVQGVRAGQPIVARNSDPTLHNVLCRPRVNRAYTIGQPFQGMENEMVFGEPEIMIRFTCDVHPWMVAYLGVVGHPHFATTGEDGAFALEGVPAGRHRLRLWHERLGERGVDVEVEADGVAELAFDFGEAAGGG